MIAANPHTGPFQAFDIACYITETGSGPGDEAICYNKTGITLICKIVVDLFFYLALLRRIRFCTEVRVDCVF